MMTYELTQPPFPTRSWKNRRGSDRPDGPSIVYISITGETVLENLENRRSRPYNAFRKPLADLLTARGIPFTKLRWSQHAGCGMCPCSPGFILEGAPAGQDYWLEVS